MVLQHETQCLAARDSMPGLLVLKPEAAGGGHDGLFVAHDSSCVNKRQLDEGLQR